VKPESLRREDELFGLFQVTPDPEHTHTHTHTLLKAAGDI